MTGLKSGSGDDLWGDDGDDGDDSTDDADATNAREKENEGEANEDEAAEGVTDPVSESEPSDQSDPGTESRADVAASTGGTAESDTTETTGASEPADSVDSTDSADTADEVEPTEGGGADSAPSIDLSSVDGGSAGGPQSYIVRRAVQDKSVQFERDERLTFFVHDDVADGERDLVTSLQSALGRDVPKFDVREAVYRAALRNPDDVLEELLKMGYSVDEE